MLTSREQLVEIFTQYLWATEGCHYAIGYEPIISWIYKQTIQKSTFVIVRYYTSEFAEEHDLVDRLGFTVEDIMMVGKICFGKGFQIAIDGPKNAYKRRKSAAKPEEIESCTLPNS